MKLRKKKKFYSEYLSDLMYEISLDPYWREKLFNAPVGERFTFSADDLKRFDRELRIHILVNNLKFTVFNDGWTSDGFVVFGFSCVEFPKLATYSTNNPNII